MKKYSNYLPGNPAKKAVWANNFSETIEQVGASLNLTAEEIGSSRGTCEKLIDSVNRVELKRTQLGEAVSFRDAYSLEFDAAIRTLIARIKANAAYTDAIGKNLGIVASGQSVDTDNVQPTVKLFAYPGYVTVKFNKKRMVGVTIYSRVKGSTGWEKVANATKSPYIDVRPLAEANKAETREYMALCFDGAEDIGHQSDIGTIVFGG